MFPQLTVVQIFSVIHFVAQIFGYTAFHYPAQKKKLSLIGCASFVVNLAISIYQFYMYLNIVINKEEATIIDMPNSKIANVGISIITFSSLIVRVAILILNFFLRGKIFESVKRIEELDNELKSVGITFNNNRDFVIFIVMCFFKVLFIGFLLLECKDIFVILNAFFLFTGAYITSDLYVGMAFLILKRIGGVGDKLKASQSNPDTEINLRLVKLMGNVNDVIKSINRGLSMQVMVTIVNLLLFGITLIFFATTLKIFATLSIVQIAVTVIFIHYILFEISVIGYQTNEQIKEVHSVLRKTYNSMPKKENLKFLDVNLNVAKYNCGLFDFDWEMIKMVLSAEVIYLVTMTQFQQMMN